MSCGQATPPRVRRHFHPHGQSATVNPNLLQASPQNRTATPVSTPPLPARTPPQLRHPASCPRGDGRARWRPRGISARIRTVRIRAGWGSAISAPMGIPAVDHGTSCGGYFQETHGTPLHGKRVAPEKLVWAVGALAEGLGIRAVARVFEVDPNTVLAWLVEVADHAAAFSRYFLHDVRVTQVQLDELFALLSAVKAGEVSDPEAIQRLSRSPHWVWGALDPVTKLLLTIDVGDRTLAMAQSVVHQVVQVLAPGCVPLFLSDGFKEYTTALLTHFGQWVQPPRRQDKGPLPKPRWMPLPELLYAQVVKTVRRRRLVD